MKNKLALQQFIEQHPDWEKLLSEKPYCITISRDELFGKKLIMFKYSQIDSDFGIDLVRECRGLILDESTYEVVSYAFNKFGNYGESYCPQIDWKNCWVGQKIDGSIIKVVRLSSGQLLISTNGTIDAFKASLPEQIGCKAKSFGDLFVEALQNAKEADERKALKLNLTFPDGLETDPLKWLCSRIYPGHTYMFELTSPFNKVVVPWHETKVWLLGERDNTTFKETYFSDSFLRNVFDTPKVFNLGSIDECILAASNLPADEEGYVVCDKNFNRVKVKSPTYVALHHMKNNGVLSYERGLEIVRGNELGEVLTYFPEFNQHLLEIKEKYNAFCAEMHNLEHKLCDWLAVEAYDCQPWLIAAGGSKRKELAKWAFQNTKYTGFVFAYADGKVHSADEWLQNMPSSKLVATLGFKD